MSCFILENIRQAYQKKNYIDTDELKMSTDYDDESVFKPKKEYMDMYDKIRNKINNIKK